ncbi:unnamed protein product, partial [Nesidiocoris tenuis]
MKLSFSPAPEPSDRYYLSRRKRTNRLSPEEGEDHFSLLCLDSDYLPSNTYTDRLSA